MLVAQLASRVESCGESEKTFSRLHVAMQVFFYKNLYVYMHEYITLSEYLLAI